MTDSTSFHIHGVDVFGITAEGHEYSVMATLQPKYNLPVEVALELHSVVGPAQAALGLPHLAELGYALYSQEIDQYAPTCCSEFSFKRFVPDEQ